MSILDRWKIEDIERNANEAKRRLYELDSLDRRVDTLERSLRESRTEVSGLRDLLQAQEDRLTDLLNRLNA